MIFWAPAPVVVLKTVFFWHESFPILTTYYLLSATCYLLPTLLSFCYPYHCHCHYCRDGVLVSYAAWILFAREAWLSAESCFNGHRSHSRRPLRTRNTSYFPHCPPRALAGNGGDKHEQRQRHEQHEAEVGA